MAAVSVPAVVIKTEPEDEPEPDRELQFGSDGAPRLREPAVPLSAAVSGAQPLRWSQDHRLSVNTGGGVTLMELRCDSRSRGAGMTLQRSLVPVQSHKLRVGTAAEEAEVMEKFSSHSDPAIRQLFMANRALNPPPVADRGAKYSSWSPLGCDHNGRCLLACLSLDNRLTVHDSHKRLEWNLLVDLSRKYGDRLADRGYTRKDNTPWSANPLDFAELQRRLSMQTPLRMEWSSVYTVKQVEPDNSCKDVEMVLLAVLMENGDLVLWKFELPFTNGEDVVFYDVLESGVSRASDVAWWEYENANRRMSGLIIGSSEGPIKILPVSLTGVKGYFTLRHPIILWKECDDIAVENIRCVTMTHPFLKSSCSLIVASRGCYVFWSLLVISPAGLNVHNSHITGLHSLPVVSLVVSQHDVVVYTCSIDGWIKKLTPKFTEKSLFFHTEDVLPLENLSTRRIHGMALSHNGAHITLVSTQGSTENHHPVHRTYQVHFVALKTPETAAMLLLKSATQNLYKMADLLDIVRCHVVEHKRIPASLLEAIDRRIQEADSLYLWRFKLFLVRTLYSSLQPPQTNQHHGPSQGAPVRDPEEVQDRDDQEEAMQEEEDGGSGEVSQARVENPPAQMPGLRLQEVQEWMDQIETRLQRENMKKVLGVVYLNTWITPQISVPTCGLMDFLSKDPNDRDSEVLIGHVRKKMNKQVFTENCSLCQEVLPFQDHKRTVCVNDHMWLRCVLSFSACQVLSFRRCLLLDSIARLPNPEDPEWIQKILQEPCSFCDSPMI